MPRRRRYCISILLTRFINHVATFTIPLSKTYNAQKNIGLSMNKKIEEDVMLSDIDTKVLQSLINDNKDLTSNQNMKRLIERSNENKQRNAQKSSKNTNNPNSKYASETFRKIDTNNSSNSDNEVWNAFKAKSSKILESAFIYLGNRILRDVKLVGAIGIFALERALNDATKVLPSVSSFVDQQENEFVKTLLLPLKSNYTVGKASSIVLLDKTRSVKEELITSEDEIKQVWNSIKDILSSASKDQGKKSFLKSVLSSNDRTTERFSKSKKKQQFIPNVIDATYEFQKELEYEKIGYKTKNVRDLLENTGKSVRTLLSGSERQSLAPVDELIVQSTKHQFDKDAYIQQIQGMISNLQSCLSTPGTTWLSSTLVSKTSTLQEESLRNVVTSLVMYKKYLQELVKDYNTLTFNEQNIREEWDVFLELYPPSRVYDGILDIQNCVEDAVGLDSSLYIRGLLVAQDSLLVQFGDNAQELESVIEEDYVVSERNNHHSNSINGDKEESNAPYYFTEMTQKDDIIIPTKSKIDVVIDTQKVKNTSIAKPKKNIVVDIVDVDPIKSTTSRSIPYQENLQPNMDTAMTVVIDEDPMHENFETKTATQSSFEVEVITTNENEPKLKNARTVHTNNQLEDDEKENILILITLRILDITFYILEKVFVTGLPFVFRISDTLMDRVGNVQNGGGGYRGWKVLKNFDDGSNRY